MKFMTEDSSMAAAPPGSPLPIYRRVIVSCDVTNTGKMVGDEVLMIFHAVGDDIRAAASKLHPVPLKQLVEFERISDLGPGASATTTFSLNPDVSLALVTANGSKAVYPGEHKLIFSTGAAAQDIVQTVTI